MKQLLILALLALVVVPVSATQITFDHGNEFADYMNCTYIVGGSCVQGLTGGATPNGYMTLVGGSGSNSVEIRLISPQTSTYVAGTLLSRPGGVVYGPSVFLRDSGLSILYQTWKDDYSGRYEVVVSGGTAYYYKNGSLLKNSTPLATTPNYIGLGTYGDPTGSASVVWDDYIYGTSEDTHILSIPVDDYELQKDVVGITGEGLVYSGNRTALSTSNMQTRFSRSALYDNENETIVFRNVETQTAYLTQYLPAGSYAGTLNWNLTQFFDSGAPYGFYEVAIPASGSDSEDIYYGAVGASVVFDAASYTTASTAGITYTVTDSGTPSYWNPGTYDYRIDVISATTGETYCSEDIATSTGSVTCQFESDDTVGTVWAILIAKDKITNDDLWMGYDYADLNAYVSFTGYVNAETGLPISGANVNITQGSITNTATTIADGNYSLTGYISGSSLTFNVTASGYGQYYYSLTPLSPETVNLNFTLVSLSRAAVGSTIGGVARDGVLTGSVITRGYGRPISGATVYIKNTTNSESYTRTTNVAGYYVCGETESCFLTPSRPYDLWGERGGYGNSQNYTAVAG